MGVGQQSSEGATITASITWMMPLEASRSVVLIGAPLGVIETKVGVANFSLCALLCYGSASLLLAGLLKMRRPLTAAA